MEKNEKLIRYSMQLAYLHTLLSAVMCKQNFTNSCNQNSPVFAT